MTKGSAGALQVNCLVQLKLSADGDLRSEGAPGKSKAPRSIAGLDGPVEGEGAWGASRSVRSINLSATVSFQPNTPLKKPRWCGAELGRSLRIVARSE